ncbi:MAG: GDP-L-fucose synthase [Rikenellaceae bacterium]
MEKTAKIYVAGDHGMVGSAIVRNLKSKGYTNIIGKTHAELDLTNQAAVLSFFETEKPEYVFLAAAKVGGIVANTLFRGQFIYENLMIQNNIIHSSYLTRVKKLMFLGSSCIYPRLATQPMKEDELLTGALEETNEPYALAKIAGIKMCDAYRSQYGCNFVSVMPTNLYGEGDNYNLETSHVLPALIRKMHLGKMLYSNNETAVRDDLNKRPIYGIDGKGEWKNILETLSKFGITERQIELWGTGSPLREFLNADDMADATVFVMENYNKAGHVNVGSSTEYTIKEMAEMVKEIVGYNGDIVWNSDKPDGTPRKLMDSTLLFSMGWKPQIRLIEGLKSVYDGYKTK